MKPTDEKLLPRWRDLCRRLGLRGQTLGAGRNLVRRYGEPHRRYHNAEHLTECLGMLARFKAPAEDPDAAEAAVWFHDAIYVVGARDNERRSAALARAVLTKLGLDASRADAVARMIVATEHREEPPTPDAKLVCDADLSILARPWARYARFAAAIREEAHLPAAEFNRLRAAFLNSLLAREHVFHTDAFRREFESAARANMRREIESLA